jgi:hypothetical protein
MKGRGISIPLLQEDIEEFSEASSLFRFKRNVMVKHRIYPVADQASDNYLLNLKH